LQAKYKRKFEVAINPGNEQTTPVGSGTSPWFPDLVLQSADRRKLLGVVEVETVESVNHLEAMSQWAAFGRLKVPFHLYLPTGCVDNARRFCADMSIPVAEMWVYQTVSDQLRFTLVHRVPQPGDAKAKANGKTKVAEAASSAKPRAAAARRTGGAGKTKVAATAAAKTSRTTRTPAGRSRAAGPSTRPAPAASSRRPAAKATSTSRGTAAKARKTKSSGGSSRAAKRR
jgi:hypothetical protein